MKYHYNLHIHSCLSPCADNEMTPNNIAGMAMLAGYQIAALTDHNSCKNCPAFFEACRRVGVIPVAGMELTTAEDIHLICLFETLEAALCFDDAVGRHRILIPNRTDIFGEQLVLDGDDNVTGREEHLLSNATGLMLEEAAALARDYSAAVYPAHVDREGNGILAILGDLPEEPAFSAAEFHDGGKIPEYLAKYPRLAGKTAIVCSDAHFLEGLPDAAYCFEWEEAGEDEIRRRLIRLLSGLETEGNG